MEKTLIMSLENHHIYYVTDSKAAFYIAVSYKKFNKTNRKRWIVRKPSKELYRY